MSEGTTVSIVIPCRNEERFIANCLDSILANDFPKQRLEVLVVDGNSEDRTRSIVDGYLVQHSFIRMIDNPRAITPVAFNLGITHSRGDLVMLMSAHATLASDAIRKCAEYSGLYGADNVGGIWKIYPRGQSGFDRAACFALAHRFGVGGALYRIPGQRQPRWVDTAAYGCYKRGVFDRIGMFNERLVHSQDIEFNLRLMRSGGRTLLAPDVVIRYFARTNFTSFCKHNFQTGMWVILPFLYSAGMPIRGRHLVPLIFVSSLVVLVALGLFASAGWWLLAAVLLTYAVCSVGAACQVASAQKDLQQLGLMPIAFASLHLSYGLGSLWGFAKLCGNRSLWSKRLLQLVMTERVDKDLAQHLGSRRR